uniref:Uncharacterized protein n=1 Tax=Rhizophora mucronata TaxID=61149 RepID=A0A2P2JCT7_RHIMU
MIQLQTVLTCVIDAYSLALSRIVITSFFHTGKSSTSWNYQLAWPHGEAAKLQGATVKSDVC